MNDNSENLNTSCTVKINMYYGEKKVREPVFWTKLGRHLEIKFGLRKKTFFESFLNTLKPLKIHYICSKDAYDKILDIQKRLEKSADNIFSNPNVDLIGHEKNFGSIIDDNILKVFITDISDEKSRAEKIFPSFLATVGEAYFDYHVLMFFPGYLSLLSKSSNGLKCRQTDLIFKTTSIENVREYFEMISNQDLLKDPLPTGIKFIGEKWEYANMDGSPDMRRKNNTKSIYYKADGYVIETSHPDIFWEFFGYENSIDIEEIVSISKELNDIKITSLN